MALPSVWMERGRPCRKQEQLTRGLVSQPRNLTSDSRAVDGVDGIGALTDSPMPLTVFLRMHRRELGMTGSGFSGLRAPYSQFPCHGTNSTKANMPRASSVWLLPFSLPSPMKAWRCSPRVGKLIGDKLGCHAECSGLERCTLNTVQVCIATHESRWSLLGARAFFVYR